MRAAAFRPATPALIPWLCRLLWPLLVVATVVGSAHADPVATTARPDPALSAAAVVQLQLAALAHVDRPTRDAGLATVFGFASPGNRDLTGPLKRFAAMIRDGYPEMLNHRSTTLTPLVMDGEIALQGVELIDREGRPHRYVFQLSKQKDGEFKDCWMTDSVFEAPDKPEIAT